MVGVGNQEHSSLVVDGVDLVELYLSIVGDYALGGIKPAGASI